MISPNALTIAVSGLRAQSARTSEIAHNVANVGTPGFRPADVRTVSIEAGGRGAGVVPKRRAAENAGGGDVDLARQFADLIETEISYQANAKALRSAGDMLGRLIDTVA